MEIGAAGVKPNQQRVPAMDQQELAREMERLDRESPSAASFPAIAMCMQPLETVHGRYLW